MTSPSVAIVAVAAIALLSYGDGAGQRDARSELIVLCDDVTGTRCDECCDIVAMEFRDGGSGLIDNCEDVMSPSSYLPSTLLSRGEFNDPCNDIWDGLPGLIDDCDKISLTLSASSVE